MDGVTCSTPKHSLTSRQGFLRHVGALPGTIVHGHTVTRSAAPVVAAHRVSLDTGAYRTGRLTTAVIDPDSPEVAFVVATPGGVASVDPVALDLADPAAAYLC